jgi:Zn-dependent peptidase ImmA (M78 family)/transcriptional regulator with XRE-family HTH domain
MKGSKRLLLAKRIKAARERLSLTQEQLAKMTSLGLLQTVSDIELGKREVKAWELVNIAHALRLDVSYFLATEKPKNPPIILWRKVPKENRSLLEATFLQRCNQYHILEKLCGGVQSHKLPCVDIGTEIINDLRANSLAIQVSGQLNLGAKPAKTLEKVLEDYYLVKIWYMDLGEQGSAATVVDDFGAAILINSKEPPWRRNFSFAHEVFHLITWDYLPPNKLQTDKQLLEKVEKVANTFASNLLLPADTVSESFEARLKNNKIIYLDLVEIAREFDVSTEALIYRLCNLRLIERKIGEAVLEDRHFRELDKESMPRHWRIPPSIPERFVRLAFVAYKRGNLSRSRLAELLDTSLIDLPNVLLGYGFDEKEDYETEISTA